jgi:hypothetical protein
MTRDEARHRSLLPRTKAGYALVVKHGPVLIADVIATEDEAVIRERGRLYSEVGRLSTFVVPTGVYVDVSDVLSLLDEPLSDPDAERQRAIGEAERARLRREYDERMEMIGAASPPADVSPWDILRWVRDELLVDDPSTALPAAQEPERKF